MSGTQYIAYISDVGADRLKPLFISGCVLTTILLDISFGADRYLRHKGRLVPNASTTEKVLSGLTIFFAIIGTAGLILLSIFDTARHPKLHDVFLLFFIAGYVLSAIFICWEYQRLGNRNFTLPPFFSPLEKLTIPPRLPRSPCPADLLLDQASLRRRRNYASYRFRRMYLYRQLQPRRGT